jgi:hypothetical protein
MESISEQINKLLLEKLNNYKDIAVENSDLYFKLVKQIESKNGLEINSALINRLDDILEDLVTANVNMKALKYLISNNMEIYDSQRVSDRTQRTADIQRNNLLPILFLLVNTLENSS